MNINSEQIMQLLALLVLVLASAFPSARAATIPAGTDLVFLVDQSGSMMGKGAAKGIANDKFGRRIEAIKRLDLHLLPSAVAGYVNRISVIEFGGRNARHKVSEPQVTLSRKEIPSVAPGQSPAKALETIQKVLDPIHVVMRGDTDIARAMALAQMELDYFRQNPPALGPGAKSGERNQVVVLITDGQPYARNVGESKMLAEIDEWTDRISRDADFARFIVFGFSDSSTDYWENKWGAYWRSVTTRDTQSSEGLAFLIGRQEDAVKKIDEVLIDLIPPGATASGEDTYTAPAYLKALSFTIDYFKPRLPAREIRVLDPSGNPLPLTDHGEQSAAIRLPNPPTGQYRLRKASSPYTVQVFPEYEAAKLIAPLQSVKQFSDETIRYRLDGGGPGGRFVPQHNLPPVRFEVEMKSPTGGSKTIPMVYDQGSGDVVSQTPERFDAPGDYQLGFTGKTKAQDGSEQVVYRSQDNLKVDNATPVEAYFVSPPEGAELTLLNGATEVPVEVRFRHAHTGADMATAQVLDAGNNLSVSYLPSDGDDRFPPAEPVVLTPTGDGLSAVLPVEFGGTRWDLLSRTAPIRLQLTPSTSDPWRPGVHYLGVAGSGDFWLGPEIQLAESLWSLWIWAIALVGLIVAAVLFWMLFLRCWLIKQSDKKYKRSPRLSFTMPRNPELGSKEWPLKGVCSLSEPRLVTLADGDTWSIEQFRVKRLRRPGNKVAVELRYRPKTEKKQVVRYTLETTNDSVAPRARHHVMGLPGDQAADFILFIGKSDGR